MNLTGIIPPLITPINRYEQLDTSAVKRLIKYLLPTELTGFFVLGTTGEFVTLTQKVKLQLIQTVIDYVAGKKPVLVGVGENSTLEVINNCKTAYHLGATAVVVCTPFYFDYTEDEIIRHYLRIADHSPLPVILYNLPQRTKLKLTIPILKNLVPHPNIVGIKDSSGDLNPFYHILKNLNCTNFSIFQGYEPLVEKSLWRGAAGAVLGIANLIPRVCTDLYNSVVEEKNRRKSTLLQRQVDTVSAIFFLGGSFIANLKYALSLLGLCQPYTTSPFKIYPQVKHKIRNIVNLARRENWL